jgi:hypothetical protein
MDENADEAVHVGFVLSDKDRYAGLRPGLDRLCCRHRYAET